MPKYRDSWIAHRARTPRDWLTVRLRPAPETRFVLFAQGRTGSTLLESLLASHPRVHRSVEVLSKRRRFPDLYRYLDARSRRSHQDVWGGKIKIEQLDFQGVDPRGFLERLVERQWRIVHLWRRDTLRQAVSHFVRLHRGQAHRKDDRRERIRLSIEPTALIRQMETRWGRLQREGRVLEGLPHAEVIYEDDLLDETRHQATADRLFDVLGVERMPVSTRFRKVTPTHLPSLIENWEEVRAAVAASRFADLLEDAEPSVPRGARGPRE